MKKLFAALAFFILPLIAFGDLLPEPSVLIENEDNIEDNYNPIEDTLDIVSENSEIEEINLDNEENSIEENDFDGEIDDEEDDFDPLKWLYFGFCDQGLESPTRSYNGAGTQGEPFKMCAVIYNGSDRDITVQVDLTNAIVDENDGTNSCTLDYSFGDFLTSGTLGRTTIPADNYVIKEFEITFPLGFDGVQKGCLSYHVVSGDEDDEDGIIITIRKGFYMDFFVGSIDVKNELTISDLNTKFDDNKDLILSFRVKNIGNMENTFDIQGVVKGFFGYNKKFEIVSGQVTPSRSQYVEMNLGSLPSYGGKFDINFTINGTPYFSYDVTNANVDPTRLEPKSWDFSTSVFKMPWLILAVVVIFILLLIVLFKKPKQKVVYVQQPTQPVQPQQVQQQPTQQYTQPVQQPIQQSTQQQVQQPMQQQPTQQYTQSVEQPIQQPTQQQVQEPTQQQPTQQYTQPVQQPVQQPAQQSQQPNNQPIQ